MPTRRRYLPTFGAMLLAVSGCFGEYTPASEASQSTDLPTTTTTTSGTSLGTSTEGSSTSSSAPSLCDHLDLLILTDVSISMAPFATGIVNVLISLGTMVEATFAEVGTYRVGMAFNAPPILNQNAFSVPAGGEGCTQLGALVRGQGECVQDFDERPYLTENDDLGSGLTCLSEGLLMGNFNIAYERPRILDTLLAVLGADNDRAREICNEGFYESSDPLVVIVIADAEDESDASVLEAVTRAIGTQPGTSLRNIGVFVIGEDTAMCPDDVESECVAEPACKLKEFTDSGFSGPLEANVRRFSICRSQEKDFADVAESLLEQLTPVIAQVCDQPPS